MPEVKQVRPGVCVRLEGLRWRRGQQHGIRTYCLLVQAGDFCVAIESERPWGVGPPLRAFSESHNNVNAKRKRADQQRESKRKRTCQPYVLE